MKIRATHHSIHEASHYGLLITFLLSGHHGDLNTFHLKDCINEVDSRFEDFRKKSAPNLVTAERSNPSLHHS